MNIEVKGAERFLGEANGYIRRFLPICLANGMDSMQINLVGDFAEVGHPSVFHDRIARKNHAVYVLSNKANGKKYVGTTSQKPYKRWQRGLGYEKNRGLFKDIQRYGWDGFSHNVVAQCMPRDEALETEEKLIAVLNTMNPQHGYNLRSGGFSNFPCETVCHNISRAKMGHEVRPDVRERLSHYGRKKVVQLSLCGEPIKVFDSITEAAQSVGTFKTNIWAACNGKKPTSKGFRWAYLDRWNDAKRAEERDRVKHGIER